MSDTSSNEPDTAGVGMMRRLIQSVSSSLTFNLSSLDKAKSQIEGLNAAIGGLDSALSKLNSRQWQLAEGINRMLEKIGTQAKSTSAAVQSVGMALGGVGAGAGGGGSTATPQGAIAAAAAQGGGGGGGGGLFSTTTNRLGNLFNPAVPGAGLGQVMTGALQDLAMAPLRFMTQRIDQNRNFATSASMQLGGQAFAYNQRTANLMTGVSRMPGNVFGSPQELLDLFGIARQAGAMTNLGGFGSNMPGVASNMAMGTNAPRAAGFLAGVSQMQRMTPGAPVGQMAGTLADFGRNVGAQQAGAFYTGGAFSIVAPGGGQKSIQQWAEGILRWLEGLRPGAKRGKGFSRGELMSQYFPGSNIDAWFIANGIPEGMREVWWTYALGKASTAGGTGPDKDFQIRAEKDDIAHQKLLAQSALTRTEFGLAGTMAGQYANREQSNRWFNEIMGQVMQQVIPSATTRGPLSIMQYLPDEIQKLLMSILEATGPIGAGVGGAIGWGGAAGIGNIFKGMVGALPGTGIESFLAQQKGAASDILGFFGAGDVGDVGDWSSLGGNTTAGLHPDMRRKMTAMMRANPRLQVTSGLRDRATQMKLRGQGFSRVSGKPSAHTRGMAADMGPASEYPWLAANASRFGLKSGVGAGEPWHVGVGDEADIGIFETLWSMFSGKGVTGEQGTSLVGGIIPSILNLFLGTLGAGAAKPLTSEQEGRLEFDSGVYNRLVREAQKGYAFGGLVPDVGWSGPGGGGDTGGGTGGGTGTLNPQVVYNYLKSKGVSQASAAGILANIYYESGFNPSIEGDSGTSGGLFQHHAGRWTNLKNYAESTGRPWTNWKAQVDFALTEAPAYGINLRHTDPEDAAREWTKDFESPTNEDAVAEERAGRASMYMFGDVPERSYDSRISTRSGAQNVVFNNTFVIQGGGGSGGGIDVRRSASAIADHLENEMKSRMARRN